jgi:hypothetical protein
MWIYLFFCNWLVGFTIAEGSFYIRNRINAEACFSLTQRKHPILFEAFRIVFNTSTKVITDKDLFNKLILSSKKDLQNIIIINFFSFYGHGHHPLLGLKYISYLKW